MGGAQARRFAKRSRAQRREAVLGNFVSYFGDEARNPRSSFELDWTQEAWTRGCPVGHTGRNVLHRYGHAAAQARRAHPLGRDRDATYWNGYMDGAVRSGEVAAREALKALRR